MILVFHDQKPALFIGLGFQSVCSCSFSSSPGKTTPRCGFKLHSLPDFYHTVPQGWSVFYFLHSSTPQGSEID